MEEQEKSKMNELPTKILASNLPSSAHEEFLEMFFENTKKSGGGPVVSVDYDEESASAVIEFGEPEAVENVLKKQPLKMMGREISVEVFDPEPVTLCTIEVTGPHDLVCEEQLDTLEMYFECRKSLGDEVKEIVFDGNIALVTFFSEEVARRVAEKGDHKINKKAISVKLHSPESEKLIVDRKGFESGEDETTDNHEEVENEPALTVKVKGVKELPSRDTLEYYFDNKGRSGGFDLQEVISDEEDDDVLYVKYQSEEVARAVAERSHVVSGVRLTVSLYTPPRPPPSYRNKILIKGLKPTTTEDALSNFIEAKSGYIPVPGSMIFHAEQEGVVMVTLDRELDFEILEKMCEKRLDGAKLKISKVPISNCIIVSDLAPDVSKDTVEFYFENKRKSNGGPVSKVVMKNDHTCFVYFEDYHDARRVAEKSDHMINRKRISVQLLTPESKMQNPEMDREGSERTVDKRNYKPEEAAVKEPSQKMSENLYDIKKVGEHWLLRKSGKRFKKLSALTHAKKVELSDNYLIVDQHLIYEIQELRDDIVIVKIDDIHEYEEGENSVCFVEKLDTYSQRCDPVVVPREEETLLNWDTVSNLSSVENDMAKSLKSYSSEKQYEEEKQQMEPDIDNILSDSLKVPPKMKSSVINVLGACDSQKKSTSCLKMPLPYDETSVMGLSKVDTKSRHISDKSIADKNASDTLQCDTGPALKVEEILNNGEKNTTNLTDMGGTRYNSHEAGQTEETDVIETIHLNAETGRSEGKRLQSFDIPVKLFHGEKHQFLHVRPRSHSDHAKLLYLLQNEEAFKLLNEKMKKCGVCLSKNQILIAVKEELGNECDRIIQNFLAFIVDNIPNLYCEELKLENDGCNIMQVMMNTYLAKEKLLYAHYFQEQKIFVFVCQEDVKEQAQQECLKALKDKNLDPKCICERTFPFHMGFNVACDTCNIKQLISEKFPGVSFSYEIDDKDKTCQCCLRGPDEKVLEETAIFLEEFLNEHPFSSVSFSDIVKDRKIDNVTLKNVLSNELKCFIETKKAVVTYDIDMKMERVTLVGQSQNEVDIVQTKLQKLLKEFEIDLPLEVCRDLLSEIKLEGTNRVSMVSFGNKCCCIGRTEVIKMLEEKYHKFIKEKGKKDEEESKLSLKPYLVTV